MSPNTASPATTGRENTVVCIGVHILDIHGRPISEIPPGQGGARIEQIRLSAAGTAAGTAVDLAKLGAHVVTIGCIGTDEVGDFLLALMGRHGIDTRGVVRTPAAQTSATILPIKPNGDRPAFHVIGANGHLTLDVVERSTVTSGSVLLIGGPDRMGDFGGAPIREVAAWARAAGMTTVMDVLGANPSIRGDDMRALLPLVDHLVPNEEQLCDLFGVDDPLVAARHALDHGAGRVVVTLGADGCRGGAREQAVHVPGRVVDVVDTTGCGDSVTAGYIRGLMLGDDPVRAAELGVLAASLVATGLGSDAGIVDLEGTRDAAHRFAVRQSSRWT
ncbi:MAG: carbohydrate kinase family protein [Ilumatobacteraceae bacterium]